MAVLKSISVCVLNRNIIRRPDTGGSLLHPPRGDGQHHLSPALLLSRWPQHGNNAAVNEEGRYGLPVPYFQPVLWISIGFIADPDPAFFVNADPDSYPDSWVWWPKNWGEIKAKKLYFFDQKLQFTYPYASVKDVQAPGDILLPQKRTSCASKLEFFFTFVGHFCPLGSRFRSVFLMRIRIQPTNRNADPCGSGSKSTTLHSMMDNFLCE